MEGAGLAAVEASGQSQTVEVRGLRRATQSHGGGGGGGGGGIAGPNPPGSEGSARVAKLEIRPFHPLSEPSPSWLTLLCAHRTCAALSTPHSVPAFVGFSPSPFILEPPPFMALAPPLRGLPDHRHSLAPPLSVLPNVFHFTSAPATSLP